MASSANIVFIGSASVDFFAYAPRLPSPGETLHGTKFMTSYGGKGANQCVAAAKLGGKTCFIARLGNDQWGKDYKTYLEDLLIDTTFIKITPDTSTGIAQIVVAEDGENQIVIVTGANKKLGLVDVEESIDAIRNAEILVGQLETPFESTLAAFKLNTGLRILNAAPARSGIDEIFPYCSILCVNEPEATLLTNVLVDNLTNASKAVKELLRKGCGIVIVTLGKDGAVYATKEDNTCIHVSTKEVVPIDTTGAGDAFIGALATYLSLYKEKPLHQIIGAACEVASISVTKEGTQSSYPTSYDIFNKEYKYKTMD